MKGFFYRNWEEPTYLGPMVLIRVFCGYYFLAAAVTKLSVNYFREPFYTDQLRKAIATHLSSGYAAFLTNWVIPNIDFFKFLNWFGELLLGTALVLGLFTRLAALVGIFVLLNYWYALGSLPLVPQVNKLITFGLTVSFLTAAGRSFGIDRWLHEKYPRNPLF